MSDNLGSGSDQKGTEQVVGGATPPAGGATPPSFEDWIKGQDEAVKGVISTRFAALENTVKATRDERDAFQRQIKELLPKAEKGSEYEKTLLEMKANLETAEKRATFIEEAVKPEIGCRNPKAAYVLAVAEQLFDRRGFPDWNAIKTAYPELFGRPGAPGNAGDGTDQPPAKSDMNTMIRRAAGR
jgi:hypothetical protein